MCSRFNIHTSLAEIARLFQVDARLNLPPRYNVAPTQTVLVVRAGEAPQAGAEPEPEAEAEAGAEAGAGAGAAAATGSGTPRAVAQLRWGLVPPWAGDLSIGQKTINARSETAAAKPAFRSAWARAQRCLIPADGFYEWPIIDGLKQPIEIHRSDRQPMALAGLWERWRGPAAQPLATALETFTILTCVPSQALAPLHDRMPVILEAADWDAWLDPRTAPADAQALCRPAGETVLAWRPVDRRVGNPRFDDPALLAQVPWPTATAPATTAPAAAAGPMQPSLF